MSANEHDKINIGVTIQVSQLSVREALEAEFAKIFHHACTDVHLRALIEQRQYLLVGDLLAAPAIRSISIDEELVAEAVKQSKNFFHDQGLVRPLNYTPPKQNIIILRDVDAGSNEEDVRRLVSDVITESFPASVPEIVSIRKDMNSTWFITMGTAEHAKELLPHLRRATLKGKPVRAGLKSQSAVKAFHSEGIGVSVGSRGSAGAEAGKSGQNSIDGSSAQRVRQEFVGTPLGSHYAQIVKATFRDGYPVVPPPPRSIAPPFRLPPFATMSMNNESMNMDVSMSMAENGSSIRGNAGMPPFMATYGAGGQPVRQLESNASSGGDSGSTSDSGYAPRPPAPHRNMQNQSEHLSISTSAAGGVARAETGPGRLVMESRGYGAAPQYYQPALSNNRDGMSNGQGYGLVASNVDITNEGTQRNRTRSPRCQSQFHTSYPRYQKQPRLEPQLDSKAPRPRYQQQHTSFPVVSLHEAQKQQQSYHYQQQQHHHQQQPLYFCGALPAYPQHSFVSFPAPRPPQYPQQHQLLSHNPQQQQYQPHQLHQHVKISQHSNSSTASTARGLGRSRSVTPSHAVSASRAASGRQDLRVEDPRGKERRGNVEEGRDRERDRGRRDGDSESSSVATKAGAAQGDELVHGELHEDTNNPKYVHNLSNVHTDGQPRQNRYSMEDPHRDYSSKAALRSHSPDVCDHKHPDQPEHQVRQVKPVQQIEQLEQPGHRQQLAGHSLNGTPARELMAVAMSGFHSGSSGSGVEPASTPSHSYADVGKGVVAGGDGNELNANDSCLGETYEARDRNTRKMRREDVPIAEDIAERPSERDDSPQTYLLTGMQPLAQDRAQSSAESHAESLSENQARTEQLIRKQQKQRKALLPTRSESEKERCLRGTASESAGEVESEDGKKRASEGENKSRDESERVNERENDTAELVTVGNQQVSEVVAVPACVPGVTDDATVGDGTSGEVDSRALLGELSAEGETVALKSVLSQPPREIPAAVIVSGSELQNGAIPSGPEPAVVGRRLSGGNSPRSGRRNNNDLDYINNGSNKRNRSESDRYNGSSSDNSISIRYDYSAQSGDPSFPPPSPAAYPLSGAFNAMSLLTPAPVLVQQYLHHHPQQQLQQQQSFAPPSALPMTMPVQVPLSAPPVSMQSQQGQQMHVSVPQTSFISYGPAGYYSPPPQYPYPYPYPYPFQYQHQYQHQHQQQQQPLPPGALAMLPIQQFIVPQTFGMDGGGVPADEAAMHGGSRRVSDRSNRREQSIDIRREQDRGKRRGNDKERGRDSERNKLSGGDVRRREGSTGGADDWTAARHLSGETGLQQRTAGSGRAGGMKPSLQGSEDERSAAAGRDRRRPAAVRERGYLKELTLAAGGGGDSAGGVTGGAGKADKRGSRGQQGQQGQGRSDARSRKGSRAKAGADTGAGAESEAGSSREMEAKAVLKVVEFSLETDFPGLATPASGSGSSVPGSTASTQSLCFTFQGYAEALKGRGASPPGPSGAHASNPTHPTHLTHPTIGIPRRTSGAAETAETVKTAGSVGVAAAAGVSEQVTGVSKGDVHDETPTDADSKPGSGNSTGNKGKSNDSSSVCTMSGNKSDLNNNKSSDVTAERTFADAGDASKDRGPGEKAAGSIAVQAEEENEVPSVTASGAVLVASMPGGHAAGRKSPNGARACGEDGVQGKSSPAVLQLTSTLDFPPMSAAVKIPVPRSSPRPAPHPVSHNNPHCTYPTYSAPPSQPSSSPHSQPPQSHGEGGPLAFISPSRSSAQREALLDGAAADAPDKSLPTKAVADTGAAVGGAKGGTAVAQSAQVVQPLLRSMDASGGLSSGGPAESERVVDAKAAAERVVHSTDSVGKAGNVVNVGGGAGVEDAVPINPAHSGGRLSLSFAEVLRR